MKCDNLKAFLAAVAITLSACGGDSSSSAPEGGESSAAEELSSSIEVSSTSENGDSGSGASDSRVTEGSSSSDKFTSAGSVNLMDTTKVTYSLKPFVGSTPTVKCSRHTSTRN